MSSSGLAGVARTDVRFLLPRPIASVELHGETARWRAAFERVGVEVVATGGELVYGTTADAAAILDGLGAGAHVALEGGPAGRRLRRAGLAPRPFLPLPDLEHTAVVLPLDQPHPAAYAVRHWGGRPDRMRALRNRVAPVLLAHGFAPPGRKRLTLGLRAPGPSFLVAAARELGVPPDVELFWSPGASDLLSRGVLHLFARGDAQPSWVVKFSRVAGHTLPFDRDERGLRLAAEVGEPVAAHAPRLLGRFEVGGIPAAVETAALGERLVSLLESTDPREAKLAAVDRIASWLIEVGRRTAAPAAALTPELERLRGSVLPGWAPSGADETLLDGLDALPAVLLHDDLGSWNILIDERSFTCVDWEGARRHGLPLWDLVYFLAHAMITLDRVPAERAADAMADLFLGRGPSSAYVLAWIRRAVEAQKIPPAAVGRLAALSWMHHGLSRAQRTAAVREAGGEPSGGLAQVPRRVAERWLADPRLGAGWSAWRA